MPIEKSIFKKEINFIGVTEYLEQYVKTFMLMHGEIFSIIPLTTHISIRDVHKELKKNKIFF